MSLGTTNEHEEGNHLNNVSLAKRKIFDYVMPYVSNGKSMRLYKQILYVVTTNQ